MKVHLSFGQPELVASSRDAIEYFFPYEFVERNLIGSPEEVSETSYYTIKVSITDTLASMWQLSRDDLLKVLYEYVKRELEKAIIEGSITDNKEYSLSTDSHPKKNPFDFTRIHYLESIDIETKWNIKADSGQKSEESETKQTEKKLDYDEKNVADKIKELNQYITDKNFDLAKTKLLELEEQVHSEQYNDLAARLYRWRIEDKLAKKSYSDARSIAREYIDFSYKVDKEKYSMDGLYYETVSLYGMGKKDISVTKMKHLISEANFKGDKDLLDKIRNWAEAIDEKEKTKVLKFLNNVDRIQTEYVEIERNHKDVKNIEPRGINELENKLDELYLNSGIKKGQSLKEIWDSNIDKHDLFRIYKMSFTLAYRQDNRDEATEIANEFKEYADIVGDRAFTTEAIYQQAMIKYGSKLFEAGKSLLLKVVQEAEESGNENLLLKIDDDVNTANFPHEDMKERVKKALSEVQLGEPDRGVREYDSVGGNPNSLLNISQVFNQDLIATVDLGLGYEAYANAFASFISSDKNLDQLVIGLHGEWGRGKSTLMDSIKKKLELNGFTTVWFNAWKYKEEDNIWGAFLHNLVVQVSEKLNWHNKIYYRLQLYRHKSVLFSLYLFFAASLFYSLFINFVSNNLIAFMVNYFVLVGTIIYGIFKATHGVLPKFGLSIKDLFSSLGDKDKLGVMGTMDDDFINFSNIYSKINTDKKPIVIFIDDLDRCPPDRIVSVVNAINTLTIKKGFIFFIGYDKDFVAAAISSQYKDIIEFSSDESNKSNFGYDFLDKIIQVPFKIPKGSRDSILKYAESILHFSDAKNSSGEEANSESIEEDKKVIVPESEKNVDGSDTIKLDDSVEIEIEEIPSEEDLDQITLEILKVGVTKFGLNNPRSIKKFVNVFKLLVYIAYESGLLRNNQITPNQIGYYLIFNMFNCKELNYISDALSINTDLTKINPDREANVDLEIFPFVKSNLGFQFNNFISDIDLAKFTVIRNLVGRSFTF